MTTALTGGTRSRAVLFDPGGASPSGSVLPSGNRTPSASTATSFRGCIARPVRSLSTLRSLRFRSPRKTRYRPAFALADGIRPAGSRSQVSEFHHRLLLLRRASWRTQFDDALRDPRGVPVPPGHGAPGLWGCPRWAPRLTAWTHAASPSSRLPRSESRSSELRPSPCSDCAFPGIRE